MLAAARVFRRCTELGLLPSSELDLNSADSFATYRPLAIPFSQTPDPPNWKSRIPELAKFPQECLPRSKAQYHYTTIPECVFLSPPV